MTQWLSIKELPDPINLGPWVQARGHSGRWGHNWYECLIDILRQCKPKIESYYENR